MTTNTPHGPTPEPLGQPFTAPASASAPVPGAAADPAAGWSAVVYGRTLRVDQWWRALPAGVDRQGPVGDAVRAAVSGGNRLEDGPRPLLHRDVHGVLVGAACDLGLISRTMVQDRFGRPLYGFVGWYRAASAGPAGRIPGLAELTGHLAAWAGPVYAEWTALTWEAVGREEAEPRATRPVAAPWPERAPGAASGAASGAAVPPPAEDVWRPAHPAGTHLLPEADAPGAWAAAAAGEDRCVLVTGWRRRSDADTDRLTHLTSADCRGYELLRPPPPVVPPPRPAPAAGAGARPGGGTGAGPAPAAERGTGAKPGSRPRPEPKSAPKPGPSGWGRTARGLGRLGKAVVEAFWSEDPEQQQSARHEGDRREGTPQAGERQAADRPASVRPASVRPTFDQPASDRPVPDGR
ncbi:hypothetical protein ACFCX4_24580, partial [Kitasatospora sp. NPDC056327]